MKIEGTDIRVSVSEVLEEVRAGRSVRVCETTPSEEMEFRLAAHLVWPAFFRRDRDLAFAPPRSYGFAHAEAVQGGTWGRIVGPQVIVS